MKAERQREVLEALRIRMIRRKRPRRDERRQTFNDSRRASWRRCSAGSFRRSSSRSRRRRATRRPGHHRIGDAADLDPRHSRPRSVAPGSSETIRVSPIRNASAPASSKRDFGFDRGCRFRRRKYDRQESASPDDSDVWISTSNVFRFRLFTPMISAPASSASPSSSSS